MYNLPAKARPPACGSLCIQTTPINPEIRVTQGATWPRHSQHMKGVNEPRFSTWL